LTAKILQNGPVLEKLTKGHGDSFTFGSYFDGLYFFKMASSLVA